MQAGGRTVVFVALVLGSSAACGDGVATPATTVETPIESDHVIVRFPDVIDATAMESTDGVWGFTVTLSSTYDTPARYADAWRILGDDGVVYGVRELTHDHQAEQPFTRSLNGVEIPSRVIAVTIEGRDQVSGWGGQTFQIALG
jgi:hypothetical protein